jgi:uncharacterized membrane protein
MDSKPPPINVTPVFASTEDKTVAIISYLTLVGLIVAIVIHGTKKTKLGAFHLRQALGLTITVVVFGAASWTLAVIPVLGWMAIPLVWAGLFVLWLMGLISAAGGTLKPVPVLGESYQKWFASTFD